MRTNDVNGLLGRFCFYVDACLVENRSFSPHSGEGLENVRLVFDRRLVSPYGYHLASPRLPITARLDGAQPVERAFEGDNYAVAVCHETQDDLSICEPEDERLGYCGVVDNAAAGDGDSDARALASGVNADGREGPTCCRGWHSRGPSPSLRIK